MLLFNLRLIPSLPLGLRQSLDPERHLRAAAVRPLAAPPSMKSSSRARRRRSSARVPGVCTTRSIASAAGSMRTTRPAPLSATQIIPLRRIARRRARPASAEVESRSSADSRLAAGSRTRRSSRRRVGEVHRPTISGKAAAIRDAELVVQQLLVVKVRAETVEPGIVFAL